MFLSNYLALPSEAVTPAFCAKSHQQDIRWPWCAGLDNMRVNVIRRADLTVAQHIGDRHHINAVRNQPRYAHRQQPARAGRHGGAHRRGRAQGIQQLRRAEHHGKEAIRI